MIRDNLIKYINSNSVSSLDATKQNCKNVKITSDSKNIFLNGSVESWTYKNFLAHHSMKYAKSYDLNLIDNTEVRGKNE